MLNKKGQNTAEYAILIGMVVAAAIGIQTYARQSFQGKIKDGLAHSGQALTVGGNSLTFDGRRFEPAALKSETNTESKRTYKEDIGNRGVTTRTDVVEESKIKKDDYELYQSEQ